jgi:protocatechuate 3,4-dioxygenase beta subunit
VNMSGGFPRDRRSRLRLTAGILLATTLGVPAGFAEGAAPRPTSAQCVVTQGDFGDPSYKANAPVRSRVGTGFVLSGTVRSGIDCSIITGPRIEFWLAGPNGYDDAHRATVIADGNGRYRFESNFPSGNSFMQPHIHLRVAVPGYHTLVTVYFPRAGSTTGTLDLVLEPDV